MSSDIEIGDYVTNSDHVLRQELGDLPHRVVGVRRVNGPEGDMVSLYGEAKAYWSMYLKHTKRPRS